MSDLTLAELLARAKIADLVHRYAHAVRMNDVAACLALFTDDAAFEVQGAGPSHRSVGLPAISAFVTASVRPDNQIWPLIHNLLIDVDGDLARGRCVMIGMGIDGKPRFMGAYEDSFRKEGSWKFTERIFSIASWHG